MRISGIYSITNTVNGKKYIGKSIDINRRLNSHRYYLNKNCISKKHVNRYLYNAVQKNGLQAFEFDILECFYGSWDEDYAKNRELHWMDHFKTCNSKYGYNLRRDSSSKMMIHDKTKKLISKNNKGKNNPNYQKYWSSEKKKYMSELKKNQHNQENIYNEEWKDKIGESCKKKWLDFDNNKRKNIAKNVSMSLTKFKFEQFTRDGIIVNEYSSISDVLNKNPNFKKQCIYSVCDGYKKTYKDYIWRKIPKI